MSIALKISGGLVVLACFGFHATSALAVKAFPLPTYTKAELGASCTEPGETFESTSETNFSCSYPSGDVIACAGKKCTYITDKVAVPKKDLPVVPRLAAPAPKSN